MKEMPAKQDQSSQIIGRLLDEVRKQRAGILLCVAAATLASIIISFLLPTKYRAETTILPEGGQAKMSTLGALADIAAMAGVSGGDVKVTRLYPTILASKAVLREVIYKRYPIERSADSVDLIRFWGISTGSAAEDFDLALSKLRSRLDVTLDFRTDVVTAVLDMENPALASAVLNEAVRQMDKFLRETRRTNASEQRNWVESRLTEVKKDLATSEEALRIFREKNRRVLDSPQLLLEQERLLRNIQMNSSIYVELTKQFELAKIEQIKNIPLVNVLDAALQPTFKSSPKRAVIVISTFLLSIVVAIFGVAVWSQFGKDIRSFAGMLRGHSVTRLPDEGSR